MAEVLASVKRASGWSIALGILMILAGIVAMLEPGLSGVVITYVVGWSAIFNGAAQIVYGFRTHGGSHIFLEVILGIIYIIAGVYLLMHPVAGLLALTLILACFLLVYGVFALVLAFRIRPPCGLGMGAHRRYHHHSARNPHLGALADQFSLGRRHAIWDQHLYLRLHPPDDVTGREKDCKFGSLRVERCLERPGCIRQEKI